MYHFSERALLSVRNFFFYYHLTTAAGPAVIQKLVCRQQFAGC
jgi:hypothetical protein